MVFQLFNRRRPIAPLDADDMAAIQNQVDTGLRLAQQQIADESARQLEEIKASENIRAREVIALIPGRVAAAARIYYRNGRTAGSKFDCEIALMQVKSWEISENEEDLLFEGPNDYLPVDEAKLFHAARIVFDFCQKAGYNPILVGRPTQSVGNVRWWGCFEIRLRLNIPDDLKIETTTPAV